MNKKVLILGVNGMLGHTCFEQFEKIENFETFGTWRAKGHNRIMSFDVESDSILELVEEIRPNWIINCIGTIKQKIKEDDLISRNLAISVNSDFPKKIASAVQGTSTRVLQIATDCVFRGDYGNYHEGSTHDAEDLYGQSKSAGEIDSEEFMNLRTSIIGREISSSYSLTDWFLAQKSGAIVDGYANHFWNGITTLAFAKIAAGIIKHEGFAKGTFHVIPKGKLSKYQLLELIRDEFNRKDISLNAKNHQHPVDRTLNTLYPEINHKLWMQAGYKEIPSIDTLVGDLPELN